MFKTSINISRISNYFRSKPRILNRYSVQRKLCSKPSYEINLTLNGVPLCKYLQNLTQEYDTLKRTSSKNDRLTQLQPVIDLLQERKQVVNNISNLTDLLSEKDNDLRTMATEEKHEFEEKIKLLDKKLEEVLLNMGETHEHNDIVLEVNAGVGGQEAMLFAKELFEMYANFAQYKGWECEVAAYITTDLGGIRHGSLLLSGRDVFKYFKHEAGVHRVQRIPATEKSGRIHTSTVSVLALPQPTDIEINLQSKDLRIDTKRASGAGGQHVNTTDSAVRITHIPTGTSVECQVDRSQIKNREVAMRTLRARLYQLELDKQMNELNATKKSQVRSNYRNEKIRTYSFSQDRITDHRLQSSNMHNLKMFMSGNELLESLIDKLNSNERLERLLGLLEDKNK